MRIRTVKPEFWRSDDVTALTRDERLLFIGLWSYVDDNGVGIDDYRQIAGDLFAMEEDQTEIRQFIRDGLATLSRRLLIARYTVDGKHYIYVTGWDKHQRIDRPGKPRYPKPPADYKPPTSGNTPRTDQANESSRQSRDSLATLSNKTNRTPTELGRVEVGSAHADFTPAAGTPPLTWDSRQSREGVATGTGEQGNRGTGENPSGRPGNATTDRARDRIAALNATAHSAQAHRLVEAYAATCNRRPPSKVLSGLAVEVDALLTEHWPPEQVRAALDAWGTKALGPGALPSIAHELANRRPPAPDQIRWTSTTDERVAQAQALKARFAGESASPPLPPLIMIEGGVA